MYGRTVFSYSLYKSTLNFGGEEGHPHANVWVEGAPHPRRTWWRVPLIQGPHGRRLYDGAALRAASDEGAGQLEVSRRARSRARSDVRPGMAAMARRAWRCTHGFATTRAAIRCGTVR